MTYKLQKSEKNTSKIESQPITKK